MTEKREKLLRILQSDFPVTERPFLELAGRAGLKEEELLDSVRSLLDEKTIRVFGPVFEPGKLGYTGTLVAVEAAPERVEELAAHMLGIAEITHNYLRDNELNLWFTITARSASRMEEIIGYVSRLPGVGKLYDLPVVTVYKIRAVFGIEGKPAAHTGPPPGPVHSLNAVERELVRAVQDDFPIVPRPFGEVSRRAGIPESGVIRTIKKWVDDGTIRRFGARLDPRRSGYSTNVLAAWRGDDVDEWGRKFAEFPEVSHCYRRKGHPDWPYELYTMIHASSEKDMSRVVGVMTAVAGGAEPLLLKTRRELKKTSMKYFLEDT